MSQALPTTFLDRIATYPEPVRRSLQSDLTAPVIRDYMLILHGQSDVEETKVDGLLATGMVVDAFLSRLLRSKRFWTRLGRLVTGGARGPGVFFIIPCVDVYEKIDMRSQTFEIPPQEVDKI